MVQQSFVMHEILLEVMNLLTVCKKLEKPALEPTGWHVHHLIHTFQLYGAL